MNYAEKQAITLSYSIVFSNHNWNIAIAPTILADNNLTNWIDVKRFTKIPSPRL